MKKTSMFILKTSLNIISITLLTYWKWKKLQVLIFINWVLLLKPQQRKLNMNPTKWPIINSMSNHIKATMFIKKKKKRKNKLNSLINPTQNLNLNLKNFSKTKNKMNQLMMMKLSVLKNLITLMIQIIINPIQIMNKILK